MSSRIEFGYAAWRIPGAELGKSEDQFLVAALGGDNNLISQSGAVARSWSAVCIGTHQDVIRQACRLAKSCEGGSVQMPGRRCLTPEAYIAKFRRLMVDAPHISAGYKGEWFGKQFTISESVERIDTLREDHPEEIARLYAYREPTKTQDWYSKADKLGWTFSTDPEEMKLFFSVLPIFLGKVFAWNLAKVRGPGEK